jgi:hypothetical protein
MISGARSPSIAADLLGYTLSPQRDATDSGRFSLPFGRTRFEFLQVLPFLASIALLSQAVAITFEQLPAINSQIATVRS